jgi:4-aminobutyrate aminotransferase-like enzyme
MTISTLCGNPISATAAAAVLEYIEEEKIAANVADVGRYLRSHLLELQAKYPLIGDVRGMGLMQAMELVRDRRTKEPAPAETVRLMEAARDHGVIVGKGGLYGNTLRVTPPMNIGKGDVDHFIKQLDACFAEVCQPASV